MAKWTKEEIEFIEKNLIKEPKEVYKKFCKKMKSERSYKSFIYQFNKQLVEHEKDIENLLKENLEETKIEYNLCGGDMIDEILSLIEKDEVVKTSCDNSTKCKIKSKLEDLEKTLISGKEEVKIVLEKIQNNINEKLKEVNMSEIKDNLDKNLEVLNEKVKSTLNLMETHSKELKPKIDEIIDETITLVGSIKSKVESKSKDFEPKLEEVIESIKETSDLLVDESNILLKKLKKDGYSLIDSFKSKLEELKNTSEKTNEVVEKKEDPIEEYVKDFVKSVEETEVSEKKSNKEKDDTKMKYYKDFILEQKSKGMKTKDILSYLHYNTNLDKKINKVDLRQFIKKHS